MRRVQRIYDDLPPLDPTDITLAVYYNFSDRSETLPQFPIRSPRQPTQMTISTVLPGILYFIFPSKLDRASGTDMPDTDDTLSPY